MNKKALKFHIDSQDYFGSLATLLNLLCKKEFIGDKNEILKNKVNELVYLQIKYKILPKIKK